MPEDYTNTAVLVDAALQAVKGLCKAPTNEYDLKIARLNTISGTIITVAVMGGMVYMFHDIIKSSNTTFTQSYAACAEPEE